MADTDILVGTASWADQTLVKSGHFYPAEAKTPEQRLRFYATQFPVVEVDTSFYAIPDFDVVRQWVDRTPGDFTFDVKAFRALTLHQTPLNSLPPEVREDAAPFAKGKGNVYYEDLPDSLRDAIWQRFCDSLAPLQAAGKLGYVLIQLPPWVMQSGRNLRHVLDCADRLDGIAIAVEFRSATWFKDERSRETLSILREANLALVIVDEPQGFASSVPPVWEVTSPDLAVVRFHGRNTDTWTKRNITAAERFNYLYSDEELLEFVEPLQDLRKQAKQVHAMFNNCYEDKSVKNARRFIELLSAADRDTGSRSR